MKKQFFVLLFILFLFVGRHAFAETETILKIRLDMSGKHKVSALGSSQSYNVDTGISFSGEHVYIVNKGLGMGAGMTVQVPRSLTKYEENNFNFNPIYGLMKVYFPSNNFSLYIIGQLGHNLSYNGNTNYSGPASLRGGMYYGIGGGITSQHFQMEILYSVNEGSFEIYGLELDIEYSKISLSVGYVF